MELSFIDKDGREVLLGENVVKNGGDYTFYGTVVSIFKKCNSSKSVGETRVVVNDASGLLHIFSPSQLQSSPPHYIFYLYIHHHNEDELRSKGKIL